METSLASLQQRIEKTRTLLETMDFNFAQWVSPHFDPMKIPDGPDFLRLGGTREQMADRLTKISVEEQLDYQINMIVACMNQMGVASRLIELQNCHKQLNPNELSDLVDDTINEDANRFFVLADEAAKLRELSSMGQENPLDEDSYRAQMRAIDDEYDKVQKGDVRWSFRYATSAPLLLAYIFEERMAALDISLHGVEALTQRVLSSLEDYAIIRIAKDENIVSPSPALDEIEAFKVDYCRKNIKFAQQSLNVIEDFATKLWTMGHFEKKTSNFVLSQYAPVSINILPRFIP